MAFPLDFGFIPSTRCEDGDPLDVLVMSELSQPLPVGCLVEIRLLGAIEAEQTETAGQTVRNDRIVARLAQSRAYSEIDDIAQLGESSRSELERFFETYDRLKDKSFKVVGASESRRAVDLVSCASLKP